jgi:GGDEF domain-containing protein
VCLFVEQKTVNEVYEKVAAVKDSISKPYRIDGVSVQLNCSIGVSLFPKDGKILSKLISLADERMYREKLSRALR